MLELFLTENRHVIDIVNLYQAPKYFFLRFLRVFEGFGGTKSCFEAFFDTRSGPTLFILVPKNIHSLHEGRNRRFSKVFRVFRAFLKVFEGFRRSRSYEVRLWRLLEWFFNYKSTFHWHNWPLPSSKISFFQGF